MGDKSHRDEMTDPVHPRQNAPRANPTDASLCTITLRAPAGASGTQHLISGRQLLVPADGIVSVSPEDSGPLIAAGWVELRAEIAVGG
jgi:hypothetical protein